MTNPSWSLTCPSIPVLQRERPVQIPTASWDAQTSSTYSMSRQESWSHSTHWLARYVECGLRSSSLKADSEIKIGVQMIYKGSGARKICKETGEARQERRRSQARLWSESLAGWLQPDPTGSSGVWVTPQRCLDLRQGRWHFISPHLHPLVID